jgi:hypothetical protein
MRSRPINADDPIRLTGHRQGSLSEDQEHVARETIEETRRLFDRSGLISGPKGKRAPHDSPTIDDILDDVLQYIEQNAPISFDEVHDYMAAHHLSFGPGANTIDMLDLVGYRTERITVNREEGTIYANPPRSNLR